MKKATYSLLFAAALITASCAKKDTTLPEHPTTDTLPLEKAISKPVTKNDTVANVTPATEKLDGKEITVTGKVTEIMNGKDGYTATLIADDGKKYMATISIPNMEKNYKRVNTGDFVTVTGEGYTIEEDITIRVTKIK